MASFRAAKYDSITQRYNARLIVYCWLVSSNMQDHGVFGRFDLAALCGCHTLNVCYVMSLTPIGAVEVLGDFDLAAGPHV